MTPDPFENITPDDGTAMEAFCGAVAGMATGWQSLALAAVQAVVGKPEPEAAQARPVDAWEGIIPEFD